MGGGGGGGGAIAFIGWVYQEIITPRTHARSGVKQSVLSVCLSVRRKKLKSTFINHQNGVKQ